LTSVLPSLAQVPDPPATSEIVVRLHRSSDADELFADYALTLVSQFGARPIYVTAAEAGTDPSSLIVALEADPRVQFAEPNHSARAPEVRRPSAVFTVGSGGAVRYRGQWAPTAIGLPTAHLHSVGSEVTVAIVDTGVDSAHPALAGRVETGFDFVSFDGDAREEGSLANPGFGHGTHVAGIVALSAPGARILPIRALDENGRGETTVIAEAIAFALDPDGDPATDDGADVINLSLGTTQPTKLLDTLIELATCSDDDDDEEGDDYSDPGFDADVQRCNLHGGAVVISAAGNGASETELHYPAAEAAEGALSVTSRGPTNHVSSFANRGAWIAIAAPGEKIISPIPNGGWGLWNGTSMAAPFASGVAALVLSRNPDWKPVDVTKRLLDRSTNSCGSTIRSLDAHAAVADFTPDPVVCR
jgi:subtilisin family serine protease